MEKKLVPIWLHAAGKPCLQTTRRMLSPRTRSFLDLGLISLVSAAATAAAHDDVARKGLLTPSSELLISTTTNIPAVFAKSVVLVVSGRAAEPRKDDGVERV